MWAVVCDLSPKAERVPTFGNESERGPFVREVEKRNEERLGNSVGGGNSAGFDIVGGHREPGNACI